MDNDTPAARIFKKFGNAYKLAAALERLAEQRGNPAITRCVTALYRWIYRGGRVPGCAQQDVMDAARLEGIVLTPADFYPGKMERKDGRQN